MKEEQYNLFSIDIEELHDIYNQHADEGCFMPQNEWDPLVRKACLEL